MAAPAPATQNYTFDQLEQLWIQAGGSQEWAPTMAAIAYGAESGGNPDATNPSGATGLWQIEVPGSSGGYTAAQLKDPLTNAKRAVALLGDGSGISNWGEGTGDSIGTIVQQNNNTPLTPEQAQQYATIPPINATLTADVTTTKTPARKPAAPAPSTVTEQAASGQAGVSNIGVSGQTDVTNTGGPGEATLPGVVLAPPEKGVDVAHFGASKSNPAGYDLSAIPKNMLGNAEAAIKKYIDDPAYAATLNQTISEDYGYQGSWVQKIPELNGVLIWAAADLDPATAAGQNMFLGAVQNTTWYKSTSQNQRAWQQVQSQDPATAANALRNAQEQVLSTANQIGVTLSKAQLDNIAQMYASNYYTHTGIIGTESGTSQGWLDQAVIDSVTTIQKTGTTPDTTAGANTMATPGKAGQAVTVDPTTGQATVNGAPLTTLEGEAPTTMGGLAALLYSNFLGVAQNYLLYDPDNPNSSLLTTQDIVDDVNKALSQYTGTGSSGLISQYAQDATATFTQQAMTQASSVYPTLKPIIEQGTSPSTYIGPVANYVANTLGLANSGPGSVNVMDPQWNWLISSPGPNGVLAPVTQQEALAKVTNPNFSWTNPNGQIMKYDNTDAAMQTANSMIGSLGSMFGVGGL